ncbi:MAG TPA: PP2C family protein-serine/threonine phosphatase, partial [Acidimicrobiales bacterium]|nr:PP2C family protein-serine/threonine phosphatase [Acidimicrobiales bacterium]
ELTVLNAGHPRPLLIRNGSVHTLDFDPAAPVGLGFVEAEVTHIRLEPGDAVLVLSDGVIEARSAGGDIFGAERVGDLAVRALAGGESIPETVRRLIHSVLTHRGIGLEDDATLLLLRWDGT